jgi:hypothetical protein
MLQLFPTEECDAAIRRPVAEQEQQQNMGRDNAWGYFVDAKESTLEQNRSYRKFMSKELEPLARHTF